MDAENLTLSNALEATNELLLKQLPQHVKVGPMPLGPVHPSVLPLRDLNPNTLQMANCIDIIENHEGAINYDALGPILRDKAWGELPAPFGIKNDLGAKYFLQLFVIPQTDGKQTIIKHIYIPETKIKGSKFVNACYGRACEVVWGSNAKTTKKALQFMLEQMGGTQYRLFTLTPPMKKSKTTNYDKSDET